MPEIRLAGCRSRPLLDYLKSLGIIRLVASQMDPGVLGFWRDDTFVLEARRSRDELLDFLLEDYRPSPILAPWNKGSGFWKAGDVAGKALAVMVKSKAPRFEEMRQTIGRIQAIIKDLGLRDPGKDEVKREFQARCRAWIPDDAIPWFDAAVVLTEEKARYPALLGTGGNDGKLDFTANLLQRLEELFDPATGQAHKPSSGWLDGCLFGRAEVPLADCAVGQFHPGGVGGANATSGFEGSSVVNPWDFVLGLEGALLLAGAATRRLGSSGGSQASFPFTVGASACGASSGAAEELGDSARAEMWLPLWPQPAALPEVRRLFAEGRAQLGRRAPRSGLEFARAVRELGIDRGISSFQRYGFFKRSGLAYVAVPLDRIEVAAAPDPRLDLLHQIDPWAQDLRSVAGSKGSPARYQTALLGLERAVYDYTLAPETRSFTRILEALGRSERLAARGTKRSSESGSPPGSGPASSGGPRGTRRPLQDLSTAWVEAGDDQTPEFQVAASLAAALTRVPGGRGLAEPVAYDPKRRRYSWREDASAPGWGQGSFGRNLSRLLDRLLLGSDDPFVAGARRLSPSDVGFFLSGRLDEERTEDLFFALLAVDWRRPSPADRPATQFAAASPESGSIPNHHGAEAVAGGMQTPAASSESGLTDHAQAGVSAAASEVGLRARAAEAPAGGEVRRRAKAADVPVAYALLKLFALDGLLVPARDGSWTLERAKRMDGNGRPPLRLTREQYSLIRAGRFADGFRLSCRRLRAAGMTPRLSEAAAGKLIVDAEASARLAGALLLPVVHGEVLANRILEPPAPEEGGL